LRASWPGRARGADRTRRAGGTRLAGSSGGTGVARRLVRRAEESQGIKGRARWRGRDDGLREGLDDRRRERHEPL